MGFLHPLVGTLPVKSFQSLVPEADDHLHSVSHDDTLNKRKKLEDSSKRQASWSLTPEVREVLSC